MNNRIKITPSHKIYYPDKHGYTGFSIVYWNVEKYKFDDITLIREWGSFNPDRCLREDGITQADYLIEGRFFVFGSLLALHIEVGSEQKMIEISKELYEKWKPIMDEVNELESRLTHEKDRNGIHIDEIVNGELITRIRCENYKMRFGI